MEKHPETHKFFATTALSSKSVLWWTPAPVLEALVSAIGTFDVDPCSNGADVSRVPAGIHYTKADDGLSQKWPGKVFVNPPYARNVIEHWLARCKNAIDTCEASLVIALVPARTETAYWRESIIGFADVLLLQGRLRFGDGQNSAPFPSALVVWGATSRQLLRIRNAFPGAALVPMHQWPATEARPRKACSARSRVAVRAARGGGSRERVPGRGRCP